MRTEKDRLIRAGAALENARQELLLLLHECNPTGAANTGTIRGAINDIDRIKSVTAMTTRQIEV